MNVAVGRVHLSIWMAGSVREIRKPRDVESRDTLEQAFRSDQNYRAVESDKRRWTADHLLRNTMK